MELVPTIQLAMRHVPNAGARLVFGCAGILHLSWALALLLSPQDMRTTALVGFIDVFGVRGAGWVFLVVGILASTAAITRPNGFVGLPLLAPQQFLLLVSAGIAIYHASAGSFGDGVIRPSEFILMDQLPLVLFALLHSAALIVTYGPRPRGEHVE
jgi:hypothetical protein